MKWEKTGVWSETDHDIVGNPLTDITKYPDYVERLSEQIGIEGGGHEEVVPESTSYALSDALKGLFMEEQTFSEIIELAQSKKNLILQGPPGVGKTFVARRIAYFLLGEKDDSRVFWVQFHPSYSYEDFIEGFRPNTSGHFELKEGIFKQVCEKARSDPEKTYLMLIDEINRGDLGRIFGEVMMLMESDKRGPEFAVSLPYSPQKDFYVPENLLLIGMMNTADRSLALVDYALRRRFTFVDLEAQFDNEDFKAYLGDSGVEEDLIVTIVFNLDALNDTISKDRDLGPGYEVGHSFFTPQIPGQYGKGWYERIIRYEIAPLLREYWFDEPDKSEKEINALLFS